MLVCGVNSASSLHWVISIVNDHNWHEVGSIFHSVMVNIKLHYCWETQLSLIWLWHFWFFQVIAMKFKIMQVHGCTNLGCQVTWATIFCAVHNVYVYLFSNLCITILAPRILRLLLDVWKICGALHKWKYQRCAYMLCEIIVCSNIKGRLKECLWVVFF